MQLLALVNGLSWQKATEPGGASASRDWSGLARSGQLSLHSFGKCAVGLVLLLLAEDLCRDDFFQKVFSGAIGKGLQNKKPLVRTRV